MANQKNSPAKESSTQEDPKSKPQEKVQKSSGKQSVQNHSKFDKFKKGAN